MSSQLMIILLIFALIIAFAVSHAISKRPKWYFKGDKEENLKPEDKALIFFLIFFPAYVAISVYDNYSFHGQLVSLRHNPNALSQRDNFEVNVNKEKTMVSKSPDKVLSDKKILYKGQRLVSVNGMDYESLNPEDIAVSLKDIPGFITLKPQLNSLIEILRRNSSEKSTTLTPKGILLYGQEGNNPQELALAMGKEWGQKVFIIDAVDVNGFDLGRLRLSDMFFNTMNHTPSVIIIKNIDYILPAGQLGDLLILQAKSRLYKWLDDLSENNAASLIIGITNDIYKIDPAAFSPKYFAETIHVDYPDLKERNEILKYWLDKNNIKSINVEEYAKKTDFYSRDFLQALVNESVMLAQGEPKSVTAKEFQKAFLEISQLNETIKEKTKLASGQEDFYVMPPDQIDASFDEVFGNDTVKKQLLDIVAALKNESGVETKNSRGVLLFGPPGTGKTTMARALAGEARVNFINVSGSEFISRWVGEGATKIRKLFELARSHKPCIIFIDEFDALAMKRSEESGGPEREAAHIVNQLLSEMDNLDRERNKGIFVIAATNRIHVLDEALLRPGRFDLKIEMALPNDKIRQAFITHLLQEKNIKLGFAIEDAVKLTSGFSQAELDALFRQSADMAQKAKRTKVEKDDLAPFIEEINKQMIAMTKLNTDLEIEIYRPSQIKSSFQAIIGLDDVKKELSQMSYLLKNPEKIENMGIKIPKGWLFYGPPGTGKTSLARAIAGESHVNFIATSGSAFVQEFVGVGAKRVRELFDIARQYRPCILFIDEIDALAMKRQGENAGGGQEFSHTVNEFLSELDNVNADRNAQIVIIGATNRIDNLDEAVLRPGRLGKKVYVRLPNLTEREALIKLFLHRIKIPNDVDIKKLSGATMGFSGADIENLMNETALQVLQKQGTKITLQDIEKTKEDILFGKNVNAAKIQPLERERTAYHEAGHALVGIYSKNYPYKIYKITLSMRDETLGVTHFFEEEEKYSQTRESLIDIITTKLAGKIAEEIVYGKATVTSGPASDLKDATLIARNMVMEYGMGDKGSYVAYEYLPFKEEEVNQQVETILNDSAKKAREILETHRDKLDNLAKALMSKEVLEYDDVMKIVK